MKNRKKLPHTWRTCLLTGGDCKPGLSHGSPFPWAEQKCGQEAKMIVQGLVSATCQLRASTRTITAAAAAAAAVVGGACTTASAPRYDATNRVARHARQ